MRQVRHHETVTQKAIQKAPKQLKITLFMPQIDLKTPLFRCKNTLKTPFFAQKITKIIVF
jgi:hypothetical protein